MERAFLDSTDLQSRPFLHRYVWLEGALTLSGKMPVVAIGSMQKGVTHLHGKQNSDSERERNSSSCPEEPPGGIQGGEGKGTVTAAEELCPRLRAPAPG